MQHEIPKQAKLILVAVKLATFREKGWGGWQRRDSQAVPGEGKAGSDLFLDLDGDLTGVFTFGNSLCCMPTNCVFFCIYALFFNLKRILQNKWNRYRSSYKILFVDQNGVIYSAFR